MSTATAAPTADQTVVDVPDEAGCAVPMVPAPELSDCPWPPGLSQPSTATTALVLLPGLSQPSTATALVLLPGLSQPSTTATALVLLAANVDDPPVPVEGSRMACDAGTASATASNANRSRPENRAIRFCVEVLMSSPLDADTDLSGVVGALLERRMVSLPPPHDEHTSSLAPGLINKHVQHRVNMRTAAGQVESVPEAAAAPCRAARARQEGRRWGGGDVGPGPDRYRCTSRSQPARLSAAHVRRMVRAAPGRSSRAAVG